MAVVVVLCLLGRVSPEYEVVVGMEEEQEEKHD